MWAEHCHRRGLYQGGAFSVQLKERWVGSEDMMLNLFDEAHDNTAEIIFRVDKGRVGRKFLAVKDQNTINKYRSRRLMTLMHFFRLHRYKTKWCIMSRRATNWLSVQRMIQNGVFRASRTDDPNVIAIEVDNACGQ